MSSRRRKQRAAPREPDRSRATSGSAGGPARSTIATPIDRRARIGLLIVALVLATIVVIGVDFLFGAIGGNGSPSATATPTATPTLPVSIAS